MIAPGSDSGRHAAGMTQVQVLQHVPFEGSGSIAGWLSAQRADVGTTRLFAGDPLPRADRIGALIALGGPMSVNDEDVLPWLRPESNWCATPSRAGFRCWASAWAPS